MGEILTYEEALRRRAGARVLGQTFVFTNGCFDILHPGHVALLAHAGRLGHYLMVGINSDRSVRALKVDGVFVFDDETPRRVIEALQPDVLVKGGDYKVEEVVGREAVEAAGGRVEIVPLVGEHSSTRLLSKQHAEISRRV